MSSSLKEVTHDDMRFRNADLSSNMYCALTFNFNQVNADWPQEYLTTAWPQKLCTNWIRIFSLMKYLMKAQIFYSVCSVFKTDRNSFLYGHETFLMVETFNKYVDSAAFNIPSSLSFLMNRFCRTISSIKNSKVLEKIRSKSLPLRLKIPQNQFITL